MAAAVAAVSVASRAGKPDSVVSGRVSQWDLALSSHSGRRPVARSLIALTTPNTCSGKRTRPGHECEQTSKHGRACAWARVLRTHGCLADKQEQGEGHDGRAGGAAVGPIALSWVQSIKVRPRVTAFLREDVAAALAEVPEVLDARKEVVEEGTPTSARSRIV